MVYSFLATGLVLAAVSFAAVGPQGVREWIELLKAPSTDFAPEGMSNLRALGVQFGTPVAVGAAIVMLACFGTILRFGSFRDQMSAAIITPLLLSPHTYRYDFALLAIVALLAGSAAPRYVFLLPWLSLYPRLDMLPLAVLSLGYVVVLAAGIIQKEYLLRGRLGYITAKQREAEVTRE